MEEETEGRRIYEINRRKRNFERKQQKLDNARVDGRSARQGQLDPRTKKVPIQHNTFLGARFGARDVFLPVIFFDGKSAKIIFAGKN